MARIRELDAAIKAFQDASSKMTQMKKKYPRKMKRELEEIGRTVIQDWYDSYDREFYDPLMSLFNAYKIKVDDKGWDISFSPRYIQHFKHHQKTSIIYNNAFIEGYHGGSWGKGLEKKVPYWRTPVGIYSNWYAFPADQTFSPYDEMYEQMENKINEIIEEAQTEAEHILSRVNIHYEKLWG